VFRWVKAFDKLEDYLQVNTGCHSALLFPTLFGLRLAEDFEFGTRFSFLHYLYFVNFFVFVSENRQDCLVCYSLVCYCFYCKHWRFFTYDLKLSHDAIKYAILLLLLLLLLSLLFVGIDGVITYTLC